MDIFVLRAIAGELADGLTGARVRRIIQPGRYTLSLVLERAGREARRLVLSADPVHPRVHLTAEDAPAPAEPPDFCRSLRNHLVGARITKISAGERERAIQITLERSSPRKESRWFALMAEVMGRWSNIVLADARTGRIVDTIRPLSESRSRSRSLVRGAAYRLPPEQKKLRPDETDEKRFLQEIEAQGPEEDSPDSLSKWMVRTFAGVSPVVASEIAARVGSGRELLWREFSGALASMRGGEFQPTVLLDADGAPSGLTALAPRSAPPDRRRSFETMNEAADYCFTGMVRPSEFSGQRDRLAHEIGRHAAKAKKKFSAIEADIESSGTADEARMKGEILLENLDRVADKSAVFVAEREGGPLEIALDPRRSPSENAQRYFWRFKKLKRRGVVARERKAAAEGVAFFLDGLSFDLEEAAAPEDLAAVREALERGGFGSGREEKEKKPRRGKRPAPKARPYWRYASPEGWEIYVGKSALGNDALCREVGRAGDLWFHAQGMPGSHVILRLAPGVSEEDAPEEALRQAAALAAHHSRGRGSGRLNVACVPFRRVRRPRGAPPGLVTITGHRTLAASPGEAAEVLDGLEEIE